MSKNTRQGRFGLVMIVVLSIVMNLLTGCGMKAEESERTNYLSSVAEAQEIGYSETATSTASASSPAGKKSTPSTTAASTAGTGSSVCYYNWELQGDGNDGYGSNDWNFGKSVFVEGMTAEQAMSAFQEHLYRDPVMAAATIAGIAEEMHLTDVQLDEQSIQVQINRINAAAQHYNSDHTYWYADCNTVMQHLNNLEQSVEAIGAYHSACYQTYKGTNAIPEVKVCTSSHTGGHALVFRGKNIELRFRLECGFQLVDVLVVSAPETIPDEPEETTTTTTTTTAATTQPEETTTTTTTTTVVDVKINKVDVAGEEVPGAELTLTGKDTNGNPIVFVIGQLEPGNGVEVKQNSGDKLVWISGTSPTNVTKLVDGSYVLHEEAAPNGYKVANDIPFTVVNGKASSDIINMVDEREETTTTTTTSTSTETTTTTTSTSTSTTTSTETTTTTTTTTVVDVKINKVDVAGEEVPGAVLTLTGKDPYGELIVFSADQLEPGEGVVVKQNSGDKLVWISGTSPTNVTGLIDGSYILHEEAAPNGYKVANDIPFTVVYGKASSDIINMIDEREETTTTTTETTSTETTTTSTSTSTETTTTSTETTTTKETTTTATTTLEPKNTTQAVPVETDPDNGGTATEPANTTPSDEPVWPSSAKNPVPNVNDTKPVKEEPQATPELAVPVLVTASPNDEETIIAEDEAVVQTMDDESAVTNDSGETIEDSAGTDSGPEVVELELGPDGCMYDANTGELVGIPIPAWIG